jgi:PilZ domain
LRRPGVRDGLPDMQRDRRRAPRTRIEWNCMLQRPGRTPMHARTVDLGPTGMRVRSARPLATDELIDFELSGRELFGRARVMRQQGRDTYGLRFEGLSDVVLGELITFVANDARLRRP